MGIVVMQYIEGLQVMAKKLGDQWEFGISGYAKEGGAGGILHHPQASR